MLSDFKDREKNPQSFQAKKQTNKQTNKQKNPVTYKAKELDWHQMSPKQYIKQGGDGAAFSKCE